MEPSAPQIAHGMGRDAVRFHEHLFGERKADFAGDDVKLVAGVDHQGFERGVAQHLDGQKNRQPVKDDVLFLIRCDGFERLHQLQRKELPALPGEFRGFAVGFGHEHAEPRRIELGAGLKEHRTSGGYFADGTVLQFHGAHAVNGCAEHFFAHAESPFLLYVCIIAYRCRKVKQKFGRFHTFLRFFCLDGSGTNTEHIKKSALYMMYKKMRAESVKSNKTGVLFWADCRF